MSRKWVPLLALPACLGARMLVAQTVVRPAPPLDSARAVMRDALVVLRDSLVTIDGAAARLQRDYRAASEQWLLSQARSMNDACARSRRTVPSARLAVQRADLSQPLKVKRRQELLNAMDRLKEALLTCETEFTAMSKSGQAERVRGYGNDRAVRVQRALRRYEVTLKDFLSIMDIRILPPGVRSGP